jgi:adenylate cyclase class IV
LWQKLGKIHDVARSEIEIILQKEDGEKLLYIFNNLGYNIKLVWFRERKSFKLNNINIELDNTVGYGRILEAEILCEESEVERSKVELLNFFNKYNLSISSKEVLDTAFNTYEANWASLTHGLGTSWLNT